MSMIVRKNGYGITRTAGSGMSVQERVDLAENGVLSLPHRIALMLDCSSSMAEVDGGGSGLESKIGYERKAVRIFAQRCDFTTTAISIQTFPKDRIYRPRLITDVTTALHAAITLQACGHTPMHQTASWVLENIPLTRGVIVSDGEATDWHRVTKDDDLLRRYREQSIAIDCVHIGESESGEDLLQKVAKFTGGIFIKFTDVAAFAESFSYLLPAYRGLLTSGSIDARRLGAREIR